MTYYTLCFETYIYIYILSLHEHTHTHREALGQLWIMSCCHWWIAQIGIAEKDRNDPEFSITISHQFLCDPAGYHRILG